MFPADLADEIHADFADFSPSLLGLFSLDRSDSVISLMMSENEISFLVRKAIFFVYNKLGPGLFESVYLTSLAHELNKLGLEVKREVAIPFRYDDTRFDAGFRMDLLVNDKVVVEVKSIETIAEVHHKQLLTYLKLSGKKLGVLVNFNCADIQTSIFRKVNGLK